MFSLIARLVHHWHRKSGILLGLAFLLTLASALALTRQQWRLSLLELFPPDLPARATAEEVQKRFGGLGTLIVVVHSPDSAANAAIIARAATALEQDSLVHFVDHATQAQFYRDHRLLYIRHEDLVSIRDRIAQRIDDKKQQRHPFLVSLAENDDANSPDEPSLNLEEMENRYLSGLRDYLGNADGTIQILEIYPRGSVEDLEYCRALVRTTRRILGEIPKAENTEIHLAGKVTDTASASGSLLGEMRHAALISAIFVFFLLALHLFRQPQILLLTVVPLGLSLLWTMGLTLILYGHFNLFTLSINVFLLGLGAASLVHLLARYGEERRMGIGPEMAFESILLETGPAVTASTLASAGAFFSLRFLPIEGISQFGTLAALGLGLQWIAVMLIFPALLLKLQRKGKFPIFGRRLATFQETGEKPFRPWKRFALSSLLITLLLAIFGGIPHFSFDFAKTEFPNQNPRAVELLKQAQYPYRAPAVVLTDGIAQSRELGDYLLSQQRQNPNTTLGRVITLTSLLPSRQDEKLQLLEEIREMVPPEHLAELRGDDSVNMSKIIHHWDVERLDEHDLPWGHRRKFQGRDGTQGLFGFLFPAIDPDDGRAARRFTQEFREIRTPSGRIYHPTGETLLRGELLRLTLPHLPRIMMALAAAIFLVVLLHQNRLHRAAVVLFPPTIGILWLLLLLRLLHIEINIYSALMFPMIAGLALDGSLHLFQRYREEGTGSLIFLFSRMSRPVAVAALSAMTGFSGLLISGHPGLRSMGLLGLLGLLCVLAAHLIVFPALVGWMDARRFHHRRQARQR